MKGRFSSLLWLLGSAAVVWYLLSRIRIVIFVPVPAWALGLALLVVVAVLYAAIQGVFNRRE